MSLPEIFRDDDIKRLANSFCLGKAEDPFGALVPEDDSARLVGVNDGVGGFLRKDSAKAIEIEAYGVAS